MPLQSPPPSVAGTFEVFGADHLVVLALIVALAVWMLGTARRAKNRRLVRAQEIALAIVLFARYPLGLFVGWTHGLLDRESWLPMHLCEVAAITGGFALLKRDLLCAELTYFWGVAGTVNGLITPALTVGFPHPTFIFFFWLHGAVVLAAVYLVGGAGLWPRPGAVRRVFLWSLGYAVLAGSVNWFLQTNYGFLAKPPPTPSLLDLLGPWPWYILSLILLALILFSLLYLPFHLLQKSRQGMLDSAH